MWPTLAVLASAPTACSSPWGRSSFGAVVRASLTSIAAAYSRIGNQGTPLAATESLTTNNTVTLGNFSALQLTLDLAALKNGQLRLGSTLNIERLADLHLTLVNDQALPDGTKFTLIDYGVLPAGAHFNGHLDGSTLVLGLNHYRINYQDTADPGYTGAITLTVVPATPTVSLSPLPVCHRRRGRTAAG